MYLDLKAILLKFNIFDNVCWVKSLTSKSVGRYVKHVTAIIIDEYKFLNALVLLGTQSVSARAFTHT